MIACTACRWICRACTIVQPGYHAKETLIGPTSPTDQNGRDFSVQVILRLAIHDGVAGLCQVTLSFDSLT